MTLRDCAEPNHFRNGSRNKTSIHPLDPDARWVHTARHIETHELTVRIDPQERRAHHGQPASMD